MGKTYYFVEMERLEFPEKGFFTPQQMTLHNTKNDPDPFTRIKITNRDFYKGYMRLEGIHETVDKTPRRMAGDPDYLHQSIVGGDKPFDCYYNCQNKMLIMNTSKNNVIGLQRRLIKNFPNNFIPKQQELNFEYLLKNLQHRRIVGSWFNNIQGKVNAVGLFGERVNLDDIFNHYNDLGKLSAITVEWLIHDEAEPITVMFTKKFGVVINSDWDKISDLEFLLQLKPYLFKKEEASTL